MQREVKIIIPLRCDSVAALFVRQQESRIVQIAFRNQVQLASHAPSRKLYLRLHLRQNVAVAAVKNAVNRVKPQNVDVKLLQPENRVLDKETPHGVAIAAIEIDRRTPR